MHLETGIRWLIRSLQGNNQEQPTQPGMDWAIPSLRSFLVSTASSITVLFSPLSLPSSGHLPTMGVLSRGGCQT